jgi:hypothetical protein
LSQLGNVFMPIVNTRRIPGWYLNGVMTRQYPFVDDSTYTLVGEWRKPEDAQNQVIEVNLQMVENYHENYAEILWILNPFSPYHGWVVTRVAGLTQVNLFSLGDDTNWHTFRLVAIYRSNPKRRTVHSITVDGHEFLRDTEMGQVPQAWSHSFETNFETTNEFPNCGSANVFVGKSEWRNIQLSLTQP